MLHLVFSLCCFNVVPPFPFSDWLLWTHFYLLSTSALSASPSISSATISRGLWAWLAISSAGMMDWMDEIFFSLNSTKASWNSHLAPVTKKQTTWSYHSPARFRKSSYDNCACFLFYLIQQRFAFQCHIYLSQKMIDLLKRSTNMY